jgi:hypothetical protein
MEPELTSLKILGRKFGALYDTLPFSITWDMSIYDTIVLAQQKTARWASQHYIDLDQVTYDITGH